MALRSRTLAIETSKSADVVTVRLIGYFDGASQGTTDFEDFKNAEAASTITVLAERTTHGVHFDLSLLRFLDSLALAYFVILQNHLTFRQLKMTIGPPGEAFQQIVSRFELDKFFTIRPTEEEALQALR
jgi:anti-anti-sigma regulatory factor